MSTETIFDRWKPHEQSTWVFQVFKSYDEELEKNMWSFFPVQKSIYMNLKKQGATWDSMPSDFLPLSIKKSKLFEDLKTWSKHFNEFGNWTNLNILMAISSNFETYLDSILSLAIQSDPGVIFGSSKSVDGVFLLKYGNYKNINIKEIVTNCVKGDWNSRWCNIKRIFPNIPNTIETKIKELEFIRKLRNDIGHAFGRDIEESREFVLKQILPSARLSTTRASQLKYMVWGIAKEIDVYLLNNHIGEFQFFNMYHAMYPSLNKKVHINQRAMEFKKKIGNNKVSPTSKEICKQIVSYYENL